MSSRKELAVSVRGLSKAYTIAHEQEKQSTLAETLLQRARHPFRSSQSETFWALKDVSFDIHQGDVVGFIGRNGAGKSTLLKILSRITEPTSGEIKLYGRVGSLLEVGTGFHPELTGRENIFLNGAILGMPKSEIRSQFDAIVAFSGVESFLDTPVKRYSSGMYVRLAFAVAAHLNPEILIIDEVLAVGDAEFQSKCLGKMKEVAKGGRTVLFVSHNMNAVSQLCNRAVLLNKGQVQVAGELDRVISAYYRNNLPRGAWQAGKEEYRNDFVVPKSLAIIDASGEVADLPLRNDEQYWVRFIIDIKRLHERLEIGYALVDDQQTLIYWSFHSDGALAEWPTLKLGLNTLFSPWPRQWLNEGQYRLQFGAALNKLHWLLEPGGNSPAFEVDVGVGVRSSPHWNHKRLGLMAPLLPWSLSQTP